jgi:hypothetical protein
MSSRLPRPYRWLLWPGLLVFVLAALAGLDSLMRLGFIMFCAAIWWYLVRNFLPIPPSAVVTLTFLSRFRPDCETLAALLRKDRITWAEAYRAESDCKNRHHPVRNHH